MCRSKAKGGRRCNSRNAGRTNRSGVARTAATDTTDTTAETTADAAQIEETTMEHPIEPTVEPVVEDSGRYYDEQATAWAVVANDPDTRPDERERARQQIRQCVDLARQAREQDNAAAAAAEPAQGPWWANERTGNLAAAVANVEPGNGERVVTAGGMVIEENHGVVIDNLDGVIRFDRIGN